MNISAQGCTPIKPQASFGQQKEISYDTVVNKANKVNHELVDSGNLKGPLAVVASVALAGLVTYVSGSKAANIVSVATKNKAGSALMAATDRLNSAVTEGAGKLIKENASTKGQKAASFVGKAIQKSAKAVGENFKKFAYMGTQGIEGQAAKDAKALGNLFGAAAVAGMAPVLLRRDSDENGVADISEKGQNVYTGTRYEQATQGIEQHLNKLNTVADLVQTLM